MAEWRVPFLDEPALKELKESFASGAIPPTGVRSLNERRVAEVGPLEIFIFSNEHPPPHFRVYYGDDSADYRIADCEMIAGNLGRFYRNIRKWHSKHKQLLIDEWNRSRPTDCPVGAYRDKMENNEKEIKYGG